MLSHILHVGWKPIFSAPPKKIHIITTTIKTTKKIHIRCLSPFTSPLCEGQQKQVTSPQNPLCRNSVLCNSLGGGFRGSVESPRNEVAGF